MCIRDRLRACRESTILLFIKLATQVEPSEKSDTFSRHKSITEEFLLNMSHPIRILNGNPDAIRNTISKLTP